MQGGDNLQTSPSTRDMQIKPDMRQEKSVSTAALIEQLLTQIMEHLQTSVLASITFSGGSFTSLLIASGPYRE